MYTYLALGDSYTIGESLPASDNFPHQLVKEWKETYNISFDVPKVIATTGWTTNELQDGIALQEPIGTYDIVTLLIGVNNQYRNLPIEQFSKEFTQLLYKAILFSKHGTDGVYVISIPDWGVTPFAHDRNHAKIAQEIAQYNLLKKTITQINKCTFVDIRPSTIKNGKNPKYLAEDLLHYSAEEYANWAKIIAPIVYQKSLTNTTK